MRSLAIANCRLPIGFIHTRLQPGGAGMKVSISKTGVNEKEN